MLKLSGSNHSLSSAFSIGSSNPDLTAEDSQEFGGDFTPLELPEVQLEAIADALQEKLNNDGFVQDRPSKSKTVQQAFFGGDAVSLLQDLLKDQFGQEEVSRDQALQVGRQIQAQFRFFVHSKTTKANKRALEDTQKDLYSFQDNLPMQVYQARKEYPSHWDKVNLLVKEVSLGSHSGLTKTYHDCFLAKQAVDLLMEFKLVRNRKEGVHMMRKLNEKVHCCRLVAYPGNDGTKFKDDAALYQFVEPEHRLPEPVKRRGLRKNNTMNNSIHGAAGEGEKKEKKNGLRKIKSTADVTPSLKDKTYFKERVGSLRSSLDLYRQERLNAQRQNDQSNFEWNMQRQSSTRKLPL